MKREQVQILHVKFGKVIEIDYFDKRDGRNHSIEDDEIAHKDLKDALMAFKSDVAEAYYSISHTLADYITPNEVTVTEKKGNFFLTVKGKFATAQNDEVGITTGAIPLSIEPDDDLVVKLNTLRGELWEYFWNDKGDGKLPFNQEKQEEKEEENTVLKEG